MADSNLSNEIAFVSTAKGKAKANLFENSADLAFETKSTGLLMQLDGLEKKELLTQADLDLATSISSKFSQSKQPIVAKPATGTGTIQYQAIIGEYNNILPVWFLELGQIRSKAVCHLSTSGTDYKGRRGNWQGTGFLISNNILLTNYHVLNSKDVCENAICSFNYQLDEKGKMQPTQNYRLNPGRLFISSPETELDFCFVWVDNDPGKKFGYIPLVRHAFMVKEEDFSNIIQHPGGNVKSVALQNNQVTFQNETVVHYTTDTLAGSSGAVVFNNEWKPFALHHATRQTKPADIEKNIPAQIQNEGIKLSAIATYLESVNGGHAGTAAAEVLAMFKDTDAMLGYFGGLGRESLVADTASALERVVDTYKGEAKDIDIAFWNVEWFNKYYKQKIAEVAKVIVRMNMDVWVFEESSYVAAKELVTYLKERYDLDYDCDGSQPNASSELQTTTIIWNTKTVEVSKKEWSKRVDKWFQLRSEDIESADDLVLEADTMFESVDGKIFDRYPALFYVKSKTGNEFTAYVVPLHLKAKDEGSKRRILASKILSAAISSMIKDSKADTDWILGGDFNATLASGDFDLLLNDFTALSAADEGAGEMTYIKGKYKSVIDHIFISPNLQSTTDNEYIIVAHDKVLPDYLSISDHRPVLIRISLSNKKKEVDTDSTNAVTVADEDKATLVEALRKLSKNKKKSSAKSGNVKSSRINLHADLAEVEQNRNKEYYDETADKAALKNYYTGIDTGLKGTALYDSLNKLLTRTHTTLLSYQPAKYLYPWVDLQPDKKTILNIYSGDSTTPEALIQSDFETQQLALERFNGIKPNDNFETAFSADKDAVLETLENSMGFNCEHVVPQSWFNKANPMRGDLHHLFSCTPNCNSFRGNIPYYENADWEEKVMDMCGLREAEGFEPKDGKGKVARATLYFLVRYPHTIDRYNQSDIQTLIEWHINEPPTLYEKHRNASIQQLQGNRNPFIDFPKLAAKVDFSKGLK